MVLVLFFAANVFASEITAHKEGTTLTLSDPGDYDWWYGCSPTSAGMVLGHYDVMGYGGHFYNNLVPGGQAENSSFGNSGALVNNIIASAEHISDFYVNGYLAGNDDVSLPYHEFNCLADFMGTSQDDCGNVNGSTTFYYYTDGSAFTESDAVLYGVSGTSGMYGIGEYLEYAGYDADVLYNQYIDTLGKNFGFTFAQYIAEIDAGRPVLIHVEGHTMYGYGYDTSTNSVLLHNTWNLGQHSMVWGGSYSGMEHYAVTVLQIIPEPTTAILLCLGSLLLKRRKK